MASETLSGRVALPNDRVPRLTRKSPSAVTTPTRAFDPSELCKWTRGRTARFRRVRPVATKRVDGLELLDRRQRGPALEQGLGLLRQETSSAPCLATTCTCAVPRPTAEWPRRTRGTGGEGRCHARHRVPTIVLIFVLSALFPFFKKNSERVLERCTDLTSSARGRGEQINQWCSLMSTYITVSYSYCAKQHQCASTAYYTT